MMRESATRSAIGTIRNCSRVLCTAVLLWGATQTPAQVCFASEAQPRKMVYFLLVGNSNMQGRALLRHEDSVPHARVFSIEPSPVPACWTTAVDPLFASNSRAGMGPGLTFGRLYADSRADAQVGLLCIAQAGSWLNSWTRGGSAWNRVADNPALRGAVSGGSGSYGAVLAIFGLEHGWGTRKAYADTLRRFVSDWRDALGDPRLPFVFLEPTPFTGATMPVADPEFVAALRDMNLRDPRCISVGGDDLKSCAEAGEPCPYNPDLHYSRQSNLTIAGRFFGALRNLERSSVKAGPEPLMVHADQRGALLNLLGRSGKQQATSSRHAVGIRLLPHRGIVVRSGTAPGTR